MIWDFYGKGVVSPEDFSPECKILQIATPEKCAAVSRPGGGNEARAAATKILCAEIAFETILE